MSRRVHAVVLPPCSYLVGQCVRNSSNKPISNNNYVNGYVPGDAMTPVGPAVMSAVPRRATTGGSHED